MLRRAFLRGLFAAEGGIGFMYKENYIAYVAFHLSYEKEKKLAEERQETCDILAHEFHMSKDESTRNVIRKDIHKILVDLFDIEIARREFRIQQLQMELNELKDEVRKAKATKDDQVEVYLEKVTSTSERTIFER